MENGLSIEKYMTVREVSEILGVTERKIQLLIKELANDHSRLFLMKNSQGGYLLNEIEVTMIKKQIEKNPHLDVDNMPQTEIEEDLILIQSRIILENRLKRLQREAEVNRPKVEFFDQVADSKDAIDIGSAANILNIPGIGRNKLFMGLRDLKILKEDNQPYREFIDRGYFRVVEQKYTIPDGSTRINVKTLVYQKGLDFIRRLLST